MTTNEQHAERLEQMAEMRRESVQHQAERSVRSENEGMSLIARLEASIAANAAIKVDSLCAGAEAIRAVEGAKAALSGLIRALQEVHEDPYYQRVWNVHQLHCGPYKGKQYEEEMKTAVAALKRLESKEAPDVH